MTAHDDDTAVEHGPFHSQHPVGHPPAQHGGEVNQTAVGADDAGGGRLGQAQSTVGHRVVEVIPEDGEHPVEGETLPQFDTEEVDQPDGMAEPGASRRYLRPRYLRPPEEFTHPDHPRLHFVKVVL